MDVMRKPWPFDPKESQQSLLALVRSAAADGLEAVMRLVLVQRPSGNGWAPAFGRIDLARPGEIVAPPPEDLRKARVVVEVVPAHDFAARLADAIAGRPLRVSGEDIDGHGMSGAWSRHCHNSAASPGGLTWPVLDIRTHELPERGPEIGDVMEGQGRVAAYRGFDDVIRNVSGFTPYNGHNDSRRNVLSVLVWDYRGRIEAVSVGQKSIRASLRTTVHPDWRVIAFVSTAHGELSFKADAKTSVIFEAPEQPHGAHVILRLGEDTVDEAWCRTTERPLSQTDSDAPVAARESLRVLCDRRERSRGTSQSAAASATASGSSIRCDETWHRLRVWTYGQAPSERLAVQILRQEGYAHLDPSHPLGGRDGGKDALGEKDGKKWVVAVFFPREQQTIGAISSKFLSDLRGVETNGADGLVFVTNQELTLGDRKVLTDAAGTVPVVLYHLERITAILDAPPMAPVRRQFLGIDVAPSAARAEPSETEKVFGPDWEPNIIVLKKNERPAGDDQQESAFFRVRIYAPSLQRASFEPNEEAAFHALVRGAFSEDSAADLEAPSDDRVLVENRPGDLRFHRRWGWWTMGALGMAATLGDLNREGIYSVADMAMDVARFLALAGELGRELGTVEDARVLFGMDPCQLRPEFDPSDRTARERLGARLAGVQSVARPVVQKSRETPVEVTCRLVDLSADADRVTAACIVQALRKLHGARISTKEFEASLRALVGASSRGP
jgi:hypothetical protein